jgi:hypothetical protein
MAIQANRQQRKKAFYMGAVYSSPQYNGTRTQPGYAGLPAGRKLSLKAGRSKCSGARGGIVSRSYENIAKAKR